jgi:hypothetical protein
VLTGIIPLVGSALAILTAVLSYGMSRKAHALSTRTAEQQVRRGRSEETMRLLRWAVELATEGDQRRIRAGIAALKALKDSVIVVPGDRTFVRALATAVMAAAAGIPNYSESEAFKVQRPEEGNPRG